MSRRRGGVPGGWALPVQHPGTTHTLLSPSGEGIDQSIGTVRRTVLPGGLRVITEQLHGRPIRKAQVREDNGLRLGAGPVGKVKSAEVQIQLLGWAFQPNLVVAPGSWSAPNLL